MVVSTSGLVVATMGKVVTTSSVVVTTVGKVVTTAGKVVASPSAAEKLRDDQCGAPFIRTITTHRTAFFFPGLFRCPLQARPASTRMIYYASRGRIGRGATAFRLSAIANCLASNEAEGG